MLPSAPARTVQGKVALAGSAGRARVPESIWPERTPLLRMIRPLAVRPPSERTKSGRLNCVWVAVTSARRDSEPAPGPPRLCHDGGAQAERRPVEVRSGSGGKLQGGNAVGPCESPKILRAAM